MKGKNNCAWLTVGKNATCGRDAAKSTWQGLERRNQSLSPVGRVEKGSKVRYKSAKRVAERE